MRTEINLETGEVTEHEDASVTWEISVEVPLPAPIKKELLVQLAELTTKIEALESK